jgi:hypothetical protein
MSTLELLKSMRKKIATGWTQGCSARNRHGHPVVPNSESACQWCLIGSMTADMTLLNEVGAAHVRARAYRVIGQLLNNRNESEDLALYNDNESRTREEVLELLDEAITMAEVGVNE